MANPDPTTVVPAVVVAVPSSTGVPVISGQAWYLKVLAPLVVLAGVVLALPQAGVVIPSPWGGLVTAGAGLVLALGSAVGIVGPGIRKANTSSDAAAVFNSPRPSA